MARTLIVERLPGIDPEVVEARSLRTASLARWEQPTIAPSTCSSAAR